MRKMRMILDLFAGGHSVTVKKDAHTTTASADETSDVQKDAEVTLTLVFGTGYELDDIEVVDGGVTVNKATKKFVMGESDVILYVKSKLANNYQVTEECLVNVNDNPIKLHRNTKVVVTPNGAISGVSVDNGGTVITMNAGVQMLIDQGVLIKI